MRLCLAEGFRRISQKKTSFPIGPPMYIIVALFDGSEIPHHLGCIKPVVNNGINLPFQLVIAGFLSSINGMSYLLIFRSKCNLWIHSSHSWQVDAQRLSYGPTTGFEGAAPLEIFTDEDPKRRERDHGIIGKTHALVLWVKKTLHKTIRYPTFWKRNIIDSKDPWKGDIDVSENSGVSPQIIHGLIGFSVIFTILFWGEHPYFWFNTQICDCYLNLPLWCSWPSGADAQRLWTCQGHPGSQRDVWPVRTWKLLRYSYRFGLVVFLGRSYHPTAFEV